jgi:hypothetical protein
MAITVGGVSEVCEARDGRGYETYETWMVASCKDGEIGGDTC